MSEKLIITLGPNTLNALAELFANIYVGVNSPRVESCKLDLDLDLGQCIYSYRNTYEAKQEDKCSGGSRSFNLIDYTICQKN